MQSSIWAAANGIASQTPSLTIKRQAIAEPTRQTRSGLFKRCSPLKLNASGKRKTKPKESNHAYR